MRFVASGRESSTNSVVSPIDLIECFLIEELILTATANDTSAFSELNLGGVMACSGGGLSAKIEGASILSCGTGLEHTGQPQTISIILSRRTVLAQLLRKIPA